MASRTSPILIAAVIAVAVAMFAAFAPLRADDAYIVARYATQWWRGHGLVFNAGEPVNMLTSPLHALLAIGLGAVASDIVRLYQVLAAVLVVLLLATLAWSRWRSEPQAPLFLALTLASPLVAFWTVGGLETPLLLASCTAIAFIATRDTSSAHDDAWIVTLSAVAVLTRYDALLFVAPLALVCVRRAKLAAVTAAVIIAAWAVWSAWYYGDVLPTSFYVKATSWSMRDFALGSLYLASFLVLSLGWVPLIAGRGHPLRIALVAGLALELAYGVFAGTKHMMYLYRLFVPYLPALVLVAMPRSLRHGHAIAVACLALQGALAWFVYERSENPSLALLFTRDETFEFERLGARHTAAFLDTVRAQAPAIAAHWRDARPPRIVVSTGGMLPHALPDAYALELLASYRHRCKPDILAMGDYQQVIYRAEDRTQVDARRIAAGQALVARDTIVVDGFGAQRFSLAIDIWHDPNPAPFILPPRIHEPCATAAPPSPPRK